VNSVLRGFSGTEITQDLSLVAARQAALGSKVFARGEVAGGPVLAAPLRSFQRVHGEKEAGETRLHAP
jgi:hypothetical protein